MAAFPNGMVVSLLAFALVSAGAGWSQQESFPHERHERLFPLCEGCHQVEPGDAGSLYPDPDQCRSCHDGDQVAEVAWSPPAGPASYRHPAHPASAGVRLGCEDCHGSGDSRVVTLASLAASCSSCHEDHHAASARCSVCHSGTVIAEHDLAAHRGCAQCHESSWASQLTFNRSLCLMCHANMADHKPGRECGQCHAVGQPAD